MKSYYGVQSNLYIRTLSFDPISVGFKQLNEQAIFKNLRIEFSFTSTQYSGLDDVDKILIGTVPIDDYIRMMNGLVLIQNSDLTALDKFKEVDGQLMTMTAEVAAPMYFGHVLFAVVGRWLIDGVTLADVTLREV